MQKLTSLTESNFPSPSLSLSVSLSLNVPADLHLPGQHFTREDTHTWLILRIASWRKYAAPTENRFQAPDSFLS